MGREAELIQTSSPNHASALAADAVERGFEIIVAAGGDGTLNEVVNGVASVRGGCEKVKIGVLPLGTINVFARELGIPRTLDDAWSAIRAGKARTIDLGRVDYDNTPGKPRYFVQLGGAGLDALAVEEVNWKLKRKIGPVAYAFAGLYALRHEPVEIRVTADGIETGGELVLIGNGKRYGGEFKVFPEANVTDGLLHVRVFKKMRALNLLSNGTRLLASIPFNKSSVQYLKAKSFKLVAPSRVPLELDGEAAGALPVTISIEPKRLNVITPA